MEDPRIQQLLDKHAANTCTPAELAELHRWYSAFPEKGTVPGNTAAGKDMKRTVFTAIGASVQRSVFYKWSAAAAVVTLALGAWWLLTRQPRVPVMVEIQAPAGDSIRKVLLPDGSLAWLSPGSRIRYREGFEGDGRIVELPDGQVLFETGTDAEHPFSVKTGKGVEVKVLGTAFTVTAWPELPQTDVYVASGAVQVSDGQGRVVVLREKESIGLATGVHAEKVKEERPDMRLGKWMLKDADFPTIAAFVKRRYGMELRFDAALDDRRFTVFTETGTSSHAFFDTLQLLGGVSYRITGNTVSFFASQP